MSNKIRIAEEIADQVPEVFKELEQGTYKLTKTENFREGFIYAGDTVTGDLEIVNVYGLDKPGVKVNNNNYHGGNDNRYIRTSPIVEVLDVSQTTITFQTEGGVYKLEKLDS
jgi:hypothetical protein